MQEGLSVSIDRINDLGDKIGSDIEVYKKSLDKIDRIRFLEKEIDRINKAIDKMEKNLLDAEMMIFESEHIELAKKAISNIKKNKIPELKVDLKLRQKEYDSIQRSEAFRVLKNFRQYCIEAKNAGMEINKNIYQIIEVVIASDGNPGVMKTISQRNFYNDIMTCFRKNWRAFAFLSTYEGVRYKLGSSNMPQGVFDLSNTLLRYDERGFSKKSGIFDTLNVILDIQNTILENWDKVYRDVNLKTKKKYKGLPNSDDMTRYTELASDFERDFYHSSGSLQMGEFIVRLSQTQDVFVRQKVINYFNKNDVVEMLFKRMTWRVSDGPHFKSPGESDLIGFGDAIAAIASSIPELRDEFKKKKFNLSALTNEEQRIFKNKIDEPKNRFSIYEWLKIQFDSNFELFKKRDGGSKGFREQVLHNLLKAINNKRFEYLDDYSKSSYTIRSR